MYEENAAKDLKNQAKKTVERVGDKAQTLEHNLVDASQRAVKVATEYAEEAKASLTEFFDNSVSYVKKNPGRSVLGAVLAGYFLGLVSRRRS